MAKREPKPEKQFIILQTVWKTKSKTCRDMVAKTTALPEVYTKQRLATRKATQKASIAKARSGARGCKGNVMYEYSVQELTWKGGVYAVAVDGGYI